MTLCLHETDLIVKKGLQQRIIDDVRGETNLKRCQGFIWDEIY